MADQYRYAQIEGGPRLAFPIDTPDEVIQAKVREMTLGNRLEQQFAPAATPPPGMSAPMTPMDTVAPAAPAAGTVADVLAPPPGRTISAAPGFSPGEVERILHGHAPRTVPQWSPGDTATALGMETEPESDYWRTNFNTPIPPELQPEFEQWITEESARQGRDLRMDMGDYDVQGFWLAGERPDERGHGTDRFKKPNHPTFSEESIYHGAEGLYGGQWTDEGFRPGPANLQIYGPERLAEYMAEAEPDAKLEGATTSVSVDRPRDLVAPPPPAPPWVGPELARTIRQSPMTVRDALLKLVEKPPADWDPVKEFEEANEKRVKTRSERLNEIDRLQALPVEAPQERTPPGMVPFEPPETLPEDQRTPLRREEIALKQGEWFEDVAGSGQFRRALNRSVLPLMAADRSTRKYLRAMGIKADPLVSDEDYKRAMREVAKIPMPESTWARAVEAAPLSVLMMLPSIPAGVATAGAGASPFVALGVAGLTGALSESTIEAGSAYQSLLDQGVHPEKARREATLLLADNAALLMSTNLVEFGGGALVAKLGTKGINRLAERFGNVYAKRAVKSLAAVGGAAAGLEAGARVEEFQEWFQEGLQQAIEGEAGVFDNTERQKEAGEVGKILGYLFNVPGAAVGAAEGLRAAKDEQSVTEFLKSDIAQEFKRIKKQEGARGPTRTSQAAREAEVERILAEREPPGELPVDEFEVTETPLGAEIDANTRRQIEEGVGPAFVRARTENAPDFLRQMPRHFEAWVNNRPGYRTGEEAAKQIADKGATPEQLAEIADALDAADEAAGIVTPAVLERQAAKAPETAPGSLEAEEAPVVPTAAPEPIAPQEPQETGLFGEEEVPEAPAAPAAANQADKEARLISAERDLEIFRRNLETEAKEKGVKMADLAAGKLDMLRRLEAEYAEAERDAKETRPEREKREISDEERDFRAQEIEETFEQGVLQQEDVRPGPKKTFEEKKQKGLDFDAEPEAVEEQPAPPTVETIKKGDLGKQRLPKKEGVHRFLPMKRPREDVDIESREGQGWYDYRTSATVASHMAAEAGAPREIIDAIIEEAELATRWLTERGGKPPGWEKYKHLAPPEPSFDPGSVWIRSNDNKRATITGKTKVKATGKISYQVEFDDGQKSSIPESILKKRFRFVPEGAPAEDATGQGRGTVGARSGARPEEVTQTEEDANAQLPKKPNFAKAQAAMLSGGARGMRDLLYQATTEEDVDTLRETYERAKATGTFKGYMSFDKDAPWENAKARIRKTGSARPDASKRAKTELEKGYELGDPRAIIREMFPRFYANREQWPEVWEAVAEGNLDRRKVTDTYEDGLSAPDQILQWAVDEGHATFDTDPATFVIDMYSGPYKAPTEPAEPRGPTKAEEIEMEGKERRAEIARLRSTGHGPNLDALEKILQKHGHSIADAGTATGLKAEVIDYVLDLAAVENPVELEAMTIKAQDRPLYKKTSKGRLKVFLDLYDATKQRIEEENKPADFDEGVPFSSGRYDTRRKGQDTEKGPEDARPEDARPTGERHPAAGALGVPQQTYNRDVYRLAIPEIVEIARRIAKGGYPEIKRRLKEAVQGEFTGSKDAPQSKWAIRLVANLFKDTNQAAAVLAHEIGHWIDLIPDAISNVKGGKNILGRIAGIAGYLKHTISKMQVDPVDYIKPAERKAIYDQARKESEVKYQEEIDEYIEETVGLSPEDVMSIWNRYTPSAPEELIDYIKSLNSKQIKAIVKKAMEGLIADEIKRFAKTVKRMTGRKVVVTRTVKGPVEVKFRELLYAEIKRRNLVTLSEISDEVMRLSFAWRPVPAGASAKYIAYRRHSGEAFADLVSAFLNDPAFVRETAPTAYDMLIGWVGNHQEFAQAWAEMQSLMSDSEKLDLHRLDNYTVAMALAHQKSMEAMARSRDPLDTGQAILQQFMEKAQPWYRDRRRRMKEGTYDKENDPLYLMEEMLYHNSTAAWYLDVVSVEVLGAIRKFISEAELGSWMGLRRAAVRQEEGGRLGLANPLGLVDEYAQRTLDKLKERFTVDEQQAILDALENYAKLRTELFKFIEDAKLLDPAMLQHMRESVHAYSTFKVIDFIDQVPDGYVHVQSGTLKSIGNPFIETILKDLAMMETAQRSMAIREAVSWLKENDPEAVLEAQSAGTGKRRRFLEANKALGVDSTNYDLVIWWNNGRAEGAYIKKAYAEGLRKPSGSHPLWRNLTLPTRVFRALAVDHNPFWAIWNLHRDMRAFTKKLPVEKVWVDIPIGKVRVKVIDPVTPVVRSTYYLMKALPHAWQDVYRDTRTPLVREMLKKGALIQTGVRFWKAGDLTDAEMSDLLFERYGLVQYEHHNPGWQFGRWLARNLLAGPGALGERAVKIAGYQFLQENKDSLGLTDREISSLTRRSVGTPDILAGGAAKSIYNNLFLFSNVSIQDMRTSLEAIEKEPVLYAQKLFWSTVVPKALMFAAASGLLGPWFEAAFRRIPEHHKRNFQCIPLWITPGGKTVYFIMPEDHFSMAIGALFWEFLKGDDARLSEFWSILNSQFPFGAGNLNPFIQQGAQWADFLKGGNPRDYYRGRPVIPEHIFRGQDRKIMLGYMLRNTWNSLGGRVLYRFNQDPSDPASVLEWLLRKPGAQQLVERFLRVSDQGIWETLYEAGREPKEETQRGRNERDQKIYELLEENQKKTDEQILAMFLKSGVDDGYKDDPKHRQLLERIGTTRLRYFGDGWQRGTSYVNDKEIEEIYRELQEKDERQLGLREK